MIHFEWGLTLTSIESILNVMQFARDFVSIESILFKPIAS